MEVSGTIDENRRNLWLRALYMVLCVIFYGLAEAVLTVLVVVQFFIILFTGAAQQGLLQLGSQISLYNYQIIRFITFNSEDRPFPWGPWPDDESSTSPWYADNQPPASPRDSEPPVE